MSPLFKLVLLFAASFCLSSICNAARVDMKINLGGESVDGFAAEKEILDLGEDMPKMRYHGVVKGSGLDLNVFKTQRFTRGEDLVLSIPVADGVYAVTLLFAETWPGAYAAGKRVFDVYMGSKPNGVLKVCDHLDPFRSGGAAGTVRRKFQGVATQGGLTVALRPIKQNPQIAGIVIDGYSYSDALLEDLPTVPCSPSEMPDFSVLSSIGPQVPSDSTLVYDPSLNPKFNNAAGNSATYGGASFSGSRGGSGLFHSSGVAPSYGFARQTAGAPGQQGSYNGLPSSMTGTPGRLGFGGGTVGHGSTHGLSVRPAVGMGFRRQLASFPPEHPQRDADFLARLETLNSKIAQEQRALSPNLASQAPEREEAPPYASRQNTGSPQGNHYGYSDTTYQTQGQLERRFQATSLDDTGSSGSQPYSPPGQYAATANPGMQSSPLQDASQRAFQAQSEGLQNSAAMAGNPTQAYGTGNPNAPAENSYGTHIERTAEQSTRDSAEEMGRLRSQPTYSTQGVQGSSMSPLSTGTNPQPPSPYESSSRFSGQSRLQEGEVGTPLSQRLQSDSVGSEINANHRWGSTSGLHSGSERVEGKEPLSSAFKSSLVARLANEAAPSAAQGSQGWAGQEISSPSGSSQAASASANSYEAYGTSAFHSAPSEAHESQDGGLPQREQLQAPAGLGSTGPSPPQTSLTSFDQRNVGVRGADPARAPSPFASASTQNPFSSSAWKDDDPSRAQASVGGQALQSTFAEGSNRMGGGLSGGGIETGQSHTSVRPERDGLSGVRGLPDLSDIINGMEGERGEAREPAFGPGIHNGNSGLEGICIDNSTHCSCGMAEQRGGQQEECLFVLNEQANPMICSRRACSARLVCACAAGANTLCKRSTVHSILVPSSVRKHGVTDDPNVLLCSREEVKQGVGILVPII